ncbi:hypothetical protein SH501x_001963 [Pirellulaceae bacterium SH501]
MSVNFTELAAAISNVSKKRSRRRLVVAMLLGAVVLPFGGCSAFTGLHNVWTYNAGWNEKMLRDRNAVSARRAWHARKDCFANQKYIKDFARGFRAGYMDIADGGTGCVPTFPPREYWGWRYQSCEGQAKVSAWFSGFPHGARAAEEDGIGNYSQIQTSLSIQQQYAQHGLLDPSYQGMYPIPQQAVPDGITSFGQQNAMPADAIPADAVIEGEIIHEGELVEPGTSLIPTPVAVPNR